MILYSVTYGLCSKVQIYHVLVRSKKNNMINNNVPMLGALQAWLYTNMTPLEFHEMGQLENVAVIYFKSIAWILYE